jgi:hypothetical protein
LPLPGRFVTSSAATTLSPLGKPRAFDYAWLKAQARALANEVYQPTANQLPDAVKALDWDQYQAIRYRADHALWAQDRPRFQVKFFHLRLYYRSPVRMYEVVDAQAQELAYDPAMFDYGKSGLASSRLPKDLGFAGFRVLFHTDLERATSWLSSARATSVRSVERCSTACQPEGWPSTAVWTAPRNSPRSRPSGSNGQRRRPNCSQFMPSWIHRASLGLAVSISLRPPRWSCRSTPRSSRARKSHAWASPR